MAHCNIVQDLLPLYVDGLTTETSNEMIRQHIKQCDVCRQQLEYMKNPVDEMNLLDNHDIKRNLQKQKKKRTAKLCLTATLTLLLGILLTCIFLWSKGYFNIITRSTSPDGSATCTIYDKNIESGEKGVMIRFTSESKPDSELTIFDENCTFDSVSWSNDSHYCLYSAIGTDERTLLQILDSKNDSYIVLHRLLNEAVAQSGYFDFLRTDESQVPDMDYYNMHYRFYDWYDNDNVLISYHYKEHKGLIQYDLKTNSIQNIDNIEVEENREFRLDIPSL